MVEYYRMTMDPILALLRLILRGFLQADLNPSEQAFVEANIEKHRRVLWVNVMASALIYLSIRNASPDAVGLVITSLIAPVMVLGAAWFSVSFGAVPAKFLNIAMSSTLWMFVSFVVSLSAMFIAVGFATSAWLWPVLALIYCGVLIGCIQYDTADGLKIGLDEAVHKHSRFAIKHYEKEGIRVDE